MIADLSRDVIAMKRAAGRPKDPIEIEKIGALREEPDRRVIEVRRRLRLGAGDGPAIRIASVGAAVQIEAERQGREEEVRGRASSYRARPAIAVARANGSRPLVVHASHTPWTTLKAAVVAINARA